MRKPGQGAFDWDNLPGKARGDHQQTAHASAELITEVSGELRQRVLAVITESEDGLTDEQMQCALGMNPSTQRPRRVELVEKGLIVNTGRTRKTMSGRNAAVWDLAARSEVPF